MVDEFFEDLERDLERVLLDFGLVPVLEDDEVDDEVPFGEVDVDAGGTDEVLEPEAVDGRGPDVDDVVGGDMGRPLSDVSMSSSFLLVDMSVVVGSGERIVLLTIFVNSSSNIIGAGQPSTRSSPSGLSCRMGWSVSAGGDVSSRGS